MFTSPLAIAGTVMLWAGFLGGSFFTVLNLENKDAPWSTITWLPYLGCAAIGVVGVVILRLEKASLSSEKAASAALIDDLKNSLAVAADQASMLVKQLNEMTCEDVLEFIDNECVPHMNEFADGRETIIERADMAAYAAVMTEFASGERYLNRAWSEAADGYVDEVVDSANHAANFLAAAVEKLREAGV